MFVIMYEQYDSKNNQKLLRLTGTLHSITRGGQTAAILLIQCGRIIIDKTGYFKIFFNFFIHYDIFS